MLVTGASGFIGGHLIDHLLAKGACVRALVRNPHALTPRECLEIVGGDLNDRDAIDRAVSECTQVVHCAAMVSDWGTVKEIRQINVEGTRRLLESAIAHRTKRFVYLSTTDVYGHPGTSRVSEEQGPSSRFSNWYAWTKAEAETLVAQRAQEAEIPFVILRPATVYGPRSWNVIHPIAKALIEKNMILVGDGETIAGLCFVENLVHTMIRSLFDDAAIGHAFNIGDGESITWKTFLTDMAEMLGISPRFIRIPHSLARTLAVSFESGYRVLRKATGVNLPPLLSRQAIQIMGVDQDFSIEKARTRLGYRPHVSYAEGLTRTVEWLKQEALTATT